MFDQKDLPVASLANLLYHSIRLHYYLAKTLTKQLIKISICLPVAMTNHMYIFNDVIKIFIGSCSTSKEGREILISDNVVCNVTDVLTIDLLIIIIWQGC